MNRRLIVAFLVSPLATCALAATFAAVRNGDLLAIPIATLLYAIFAYPFTLVLGVPAYLVMSRLGALSLLRVVVSGVLLGAVSGVLMLGFLDLQLEWARAIESGLFTTVLLFAMYGAITACVFWWLALRQRPNMAIERDEPKAARPHLRR